jgi:gamma-glutamylcyclotransferase (GGCT)/AIG2-like uncharacterized protein YtfP
MGMNASRHGGWLRALGGTGAFRFLLGCGSGVRTENSTSSRPMCAVSMCAMLRNNREATILLAVNGTLMRGLALNQTLIDVGARFEREARTAPVYRLWSIADEYPAMLRATSRGAEIAVELWTVPDAGVVVILEREPPGLVLGRVRLEDGSEVFGVMAEPYVIEGQREITEYGGWREYLRQS